MMSIRSFLLLACMLSVGVCHGSQPVADSIHSAAMLSLDSCRTLALRNNKELKMAEEKVSVARWNRKSAATNYLPKVNALGSYMRTSREISLLSDAQKDALNGLGTATAGIMERMQPAVMDLVRPIIGHLSPEIQNRILSGLQGVGQGLASAAGQLGHGVTEALRTDTRNIGVLSAMLTQPLYMGGKIRAYHKITKLSEEMARNGYDQEQQDVIVAVDETYWKIVQLTSKRKLAQSYLELVQRLDRDVEMMIGEGFATKADGLSVKVRVNEAELALIQADNGISLLKMLLAQQCGLESSDFTLADENRDDFNLKSRTIADADIALAQRNEMKQLALAGDIYAQKVRIVRSEFLPKVVLTGGYAATNPSLLNGFRNEFEGMWTIGVGVNIPILTWGDRFYKVRAAKAEANIQRLRMEDVGEKIRLQVSQSRQRVEEAEKRLMAADKSREKADENLRYANYGLKEGVIPLSNVLAAQTAWLSAHDVYVSSQIDLLLADLYLRKSMGEVR